MKTQIKKWGSSCILLLSPDWMSFNKANIGDWVDISDAFIVSEKLNELKEEQND